MDCRIMYTIIIVLTHAQQFVSINMIDGTLDWWDSHVE